MFGGALPLRLGTETFLELDHLSLLPDILIGFSVAISPQRRELSHKYEKAIIEEEAKKKKKRFTVKKP
jgi:hypothetical protein